MAGTFPHSDRALAFLGQNAFKTEEMCGPWDAALRFALFLPLVLCFSYIPPRYLRAPGCLANAESIRNGAAHVFRLWLATVSAGRSPARCFRMRSQPQRPILPGRKVARLRGDTQMQNGLRGAIFASAQAAL